MGQPAKANRIMSDWQPLTPVADVPAGTGREFVVAGRIIALFNDAGEFYAIDGLCAHQGGPLAKGMLENGVVTCPWHGWQYRVRDGQHCLNPRLCQTTFDVKVENGTVFVRV